MKIETREREGTLPIAGLSRPRYAEENQRNFLCTDKLDFNGKNPTSPKVILRDEYEHMSKMLQCICDEAVAEGDFVIRENTNSRHHS